MLENINIVRLITKTVILLFLIIFVLFPLINFEIGKVTLYNLIVPGRPRFPYSDNPSQSYNMSLFDIEANFSSHIVSDLPPLSDEFRVFVIGDSSIWGTMLKPEDTLAGQLNQLELQTPTGDPVNFYNLGYPTLSLTKDLFFLANALEYQPDMIIWLFTLESFPDDKQLSSPIVANNFTKVSSLIKEYNLDLNLESDSFFMPSYWDQTLIGQRRNLADIIRLQLYGVMWAFTGIDQDYPAEYEHAKREFDEDTSFHEWEEGEMTRADLAYQLLLSGPSIAGKTPILFVNEPILIGNGMNSNLRYNFYYPIWAYDQYRQTLLSISNKNSWNYIDLWNLVPEKEFTNTAIHTTPEGVGMIAQSLSEPILDIIQQHHITDN